MMGIEYSKRTNEDGEAIECQCCNYWAATADFNCDYQRSTGERKNFVFCKICSNTMLSLAVKYPSQCQDPGLYKSIGWIGNYLADLIRDTQ